MVARITANIANIILSINNIIFITISETIPSKLKSKIIPGILTNPHEAISHQSLGRKVLFKIIVAIKQNAITLVIIHSIPLDLSPFAMAENPVIENKIATIVDHTNE